MDFSAPSKEPVQGFCFSTSHCTTAKPDSNPFTEPGNREAHDDPADPFGRVTSTPMCFARNGGITAVPLRSQPLRSTFERDPPPPAFSFSSNTTDRPLFGESTRQAPQSLFGVPPEGRPPLFGRSTPTPKPLFGTSSSSGLFCSADNTVKFRCQAGRSAANTSFGSSSFGLTAASEENRPAKNPFAASRHGVSGSTFGSFPRTVFGPGNSNAKPSSSAQNPLANPTANPFAKQKAAFGGAPQAGNPFTKPPFGQSSTNSFAKPAFAGLNANPFAAKVAKATSTATVNPFASTVTTTSNWGSHKPFVPYSGSQSPPRPASDQADRSARPQSTFGSSFKSTGFKFRSVVNTDEAFGSCRRVDGDAKSPAVGLPCRPWAAKPNPPQTNSVWASWFEQKKSPQASTASSSSTPNASSHAASSSSSGSTSTMADEHSTPPTLVASPDVNPYGSDSCGDGLLERQMKTIASNPTPSPVLKVLESDAQRGSVFPLGRPSVRFAARLGLARQPLQLHPARPVQSRFPSHRQSTMTRRAVRMKSPQADMFCFSSAFSRLSVSKRFLKTPGAGRIKPSSSSDTEVEAPIPVAADVGKKAVSGGQACRSEEQDETESDGPSSASPTLANDEYFTVPSIRDLRQLGDDELSRVDNFVVGRHGCGMLCFVGATDVRGLKLDDIVSFSRGKVVVYPDDDARPAVGHDLNKPAMVHLEGLAPDEHEAHEAFLGRLEKHTESVGATFLGYDEGVKGGVWRFRVEHF